MTKRKESKMTQQTQQKYSEFSDKLELLQVDVQAMFDNLLDENNTFSDLASAEAILNRNLRNSLEYVIEHMDEAIMYFRENDTDQ